MKNLFLFSIILLFSSTISTAQSWGTNSGKITTNDEVQIGEGSSPTVNAVLTLVEKNNEKNTLALNGKNGRFPNMGFYENNAWKANINYDINNEKLKFAVKGHSMALHKSTGALVIGNIPTVGDYKLIVKSGILTEKIRVAQYGSTDWAQWPDYVFEEDYEIMSLNELSEFITTEKHLPHVPSEKEVKENGVDLLEMDAAILKSVEELYLYTLELHDENQQLTETNQALFDQLEKLTKRIEVLEGK